jgi:hypothetical protein
MGRLKAFGLTLAVLCLLGTVASASALAAALPEFSTETGFTESAGKSIFETAGGVKVTCVASSTTTTVSSKKAGTFHMAFEGCEETALKAKCNSSGDSAGVILLVGEWQLVPSTKETALLLLTLTSEVHVECGKLFSATVKGTTLAPIAPINTLTTKYKLTIKETKGKPELTEYENDGGEKVKTQLLASVNGGAYGEMAIEAIEPKLTTTEETEIALNPPTAPRVELVDFRENKPEVLVDHQNNTFPEEATTIEGFDKDKVEWKSPKAGEVTKNWPLDYLQGTKIKLEARFAVTAATETFLLTNIEGDTLLTGVLSVGGTTLTFTKKLTVNQVKTQLEAHNTYLTTEVVESDVALPKKVRLYEGATIAWKWKVKETGRAAAYNQSMGSSTHNLYLTFEQGLKKVTVYLTLLDLATAGIEAEGAEAPTEAQAIAGAWRGFTKLESSVYNLHIVRYSGATGLITRGGLVLSYYYEVTPIERTFAALAGPLGCSFFTPAELLEEGKGQCSSWARTFAYALGTEGVKSNIIELLPKVEPACNAVAACYILVGEWKFLGEAGMGEFPFPGTQVIDEEGKPAQATKNPPSWFIKHFIVEVGKEASKGLYDPSYGGGPIKAAEPEALEKYQTTNIDGFCLKATLECQKAPEALRLSSSVLEKYDE